MLLYQLALLYCFEHGFDLRVGLKAFLKAARAIVSMPQLGGLRLARRMAVRD